MLCCDIILYINKSVGFALVKGGFIINSVISGDDFYKALKADRVLNKAFMFFGEEDYMKLNTKKMLVNKVCPDESFRDMNLFSFDSLDYSPEALADSFCAAPVFSEEKIVVLGGLNIDGMRDAEFKALIEAIESFDKYEGNVFLLTVPAGKLTYTGKESAQKKFKQLCEILLPVRFDRYTQSRLVPWCARHFSAGGYEVDNDFLRKFITYTSEDMFILASEIKKLCSYAKANSLKEISFSDVENVCISYEEFGSFDLANAILARDAKKALKIIRKKKEEREEPIFLLSSLSNSVYDMIAVKSMIGAGMTSDDICILLNKKSYPVKLLTEAVRNIELAELERMTALIAEADRKLKLSLGGYNLIETLICSM